MNEDQLPVAALRNLGPKSARLLAGSGVTTIAELRLLGAAKAYRRVKDKASLNLLWAIAAGLEDRDWRDLGAGEKASLLAEVRRLG